MPIATSEKPAPTPYAVCEEFLEVEDADELASPTARDWCVSSD